MEKYYILSEETIESIINHLDFESWGGAKDRISHASDEQIEEVAIRLQNLFMDEPVSETTINDFVWFECDDVFDGEEDEEDEDEEEDEA